MYRLYRLFYADEAWCLAGISQMAEKVVNEILENSVRITGIWGMVVELLGFLEGKDIH